jgi:hypothetical protein
VADARRAGLSVDTQAPDEEDPEELLKAFSSSALYLRNRDKFTVRRASLKERNGATNLAISSSSFWIFFLAPAT